MVKEAAEEVGVSDVVPEMVRRVADAMIAARDLPEGSIINRPVFERDARAAITAMREPTEVMLVAGRIPCRDSRYLLADAEAIKVWPRMIDAALSPPDGQKP